MRAMANERTPGLAGGRNTGILAATGDLIAFCDDDDEWLPGKLEAQVRAMEQCDEEVLVACGILVQRGSKIVTRIPDETAMTYEDLLESRLMEVNPCTMLMNRTLLVEKVGLVDEGLPGSYAEDYELLLRAAKQVRFICVPEALTLIHWGTGSFFAERWQTVHDAIEYLIQKHPDLERSRCGLARLRGQQAIALAGAGHRAAAWGMVRETALLNPREARWLVAALGASRLVPVGVSLRLANRFGRGL